MTTELLDNIMWHSLTGPQAALSVGTRSARRLLRGFTAVLGFEDALHPDFDGLEAYCEGNEHFYCVGWPAGVPSGWRIDADAPAYQMVWDLPSPAPDPEFEPLPLTIAHMPQMLALVSATEPGSFAERNLELGEFIGLFDAGKLIAMAGQRMHAGVLREISTVCTSDAYRGRGLGRRLIEQLLRLQIERGQVPFLHVLQNNVGAWRLYEHMGFRVARSMQLRVVSRRT